MAIPEKDDPHVLLEGVGHRFADGTDALGQVDLAINRGDFVAILGPSGCGKSTLLRLVAGLLTNTSGTVTVDGADPRTAHRQRDELAYVFQDPTLLPWRSVRRNVALPLELRGHLPDQIEEETDRVLNLVGLEDYTGFLPWQLSGGMRMRVSLARALVTRPGLLLLDEPFGALDEITRQRLNEELMRLWERDRWTGIFVTHNVYEAVYLSQRLLVMSSRPGQVLAELEVPLSHPRKVEVRGTPEFGRLASEATRHLSETRK